MEAGSCSSDDSSCSSAGGTPPREWKRKSRSNRRKRLCTFYALREGPGEAQERLDDLERYLPHQVEGPSSEVLGEIQSKMHRLRQIALAMVQLAEGKEPTGGLEAESFGIPVDMHNSPEDMIDSHRAGLRLRCSSASVILEAAKEELSSGPDSSLRERVVEGIEQVQAELKTLHHSQAEALEHKFNSLFETKLDHLNQKHASELADRDMRIATIQQELDATSEQIVASSNTHESVGERWDQIESMRQEMLDAKTELSQLNMKLRMSSLDRDQDIRKIQCEHQLELSRMQWEHEQAMNALEWKYKQTVGTISPDRDRLKAEMELLTHRLVASQDQERQLRSELEDAKAKQQIMLNLAKEHYQEQLDRIEEEHECKTPGSPNKVFRCNVCMDASVSMVFRCGHAKCSDCASRLIGLGQGCPDCRAPLDEPRMLFLSVG